MVSNYWTGMPRAGLEVSNYWAFVDCIRKPVSGNDKAPKLRLSAMRLGVPPPCGDTWLAPGVGSRVRSKAPSRAFDAAEGLYHSHAFPPSGYSNGPQCLTIGLGLARCLTTGPREIGDRWCNEGARMWLGTPPPLHTGKATDSGSEAIRAPVAGLTSCLRLSPITLRE